MSQLPTLQREALGLTAYAAYALSTSGKTYDGRDMPLWDGLTDKIREAWRCAATQAAITYLEMVKSPPIRYCKHCSFAEHLHDGAGCPAGCPGFEAWS
jgi:hypothetical protein